MKRLFVVFALVLVAGALLASTALAASPAPNRGLALRNWMTGRSALEAADPIPVPSGMIGGMMGGMMRGGMMGDGAMMHDDLEKLLGLSHEEIHDQMLAGKSLVEIAATKGVSKDQLIKALLDGHRAALDQAVKDGRLAQAQASTMLQYMEKNIETMVTAQGMSGMMQGGAGMMGGSGNSGTCPMHSGQPGRLAIGD